MVDRLAADLKTYPSPTSATSRLERTSRFRRYSPNRRSACAAHRARSQYAHSQYGYGALTPARSTGTGPVTISDRDGVLAGVIMDDRYEMVVCQSGSLELRDPDDPDCWIATDSPIELER